MATARESTSVCRPWHRAASGRLETAARRALLGLAMAFAGCKTGAPARTSGDAPVRTTIDVQNQDFNDMRVYVLVNGARTRLGIAPGNKTTVLTIPETLLIGTTYLRFVCDPIGGNRTPVTEEVDVSPGDQLVMIVNPAP